MIFTLQMGQIGWRCGENPICAELLCMKKVVFIRYFSIQHMNFLYTTFMGPRSWSNCALTAVLARVEKCDLPGDVSWYVSVIIDNAGKNGNVQGAAKTFCDEWLEKNKRR